MLGYEDRMGTRGHSGVQRDPAGIAAHDLRDHAPVVGLPGGPQPVNGFSGCLDGGIKPKRIVRGTKIVIDRLGNPDHVDALVAQLLSRGQCSLAADGDQPHQAVAPQAVPYRIGSAARKRIGAGCPKDGPAEPGYSADTAPGQGNHILFQDSPPAITETHESITVDNLTAQHCPADDCVDAGAVPAACQDPEFLHDAADPSAGTRSRNVLAWPAASAAFLPLTRTLMGSASPAADAILMRPSLSSTFR